MSLEKMNIFESYESYEDIHKSKSVVYRGSSVVVSSPEIRKHKYTKDFGIGFYVTKYSKQAESWAMRKGKGNVSCYYFIEDTKLNILRFDKMTEDWLDFIINCRAGKTHNYDIVEGPMADDTIYDYIDDYLRGIISREAFWLLAKFKYPTHQIVF